MLDDIHLVEAAAANDALIASLDDAVRELFRDSATKLKPLRGIVWVNPGEPGDGAEEWLQSGAPSEPHRTLGHKSS